MRREILLLGWLTACTPTVAPPQQVAVAVPQSQPLTLADVHWQVMTPEQLRVLAAQLQKAQDNKLVFVLDADNYNNFSLNLLEIERYIKEQKAILDMLKAIIAERTSQDK